MATTVPVGQLKPISRKSCKLQEDITYLFYEQTYVVDMYAKCGNIYDACNIFHRMQEQNVVSRTAMITRYAQHGLGKKAFLFGKM